GQAGVDLEIVPVRSTRWADWPRRFVRPGLGGTGCNTAGFIEFRQREMSRSREAFRDGCRPPPVSWAVDWCVSNGLKPPPLHVNAGRRSHPKPRARSLKKQTDRSVTFC